MPIVSQQDLNAFGAAVCRARSLNGWTLDQLGAKLEPSVGKSFISKVEKGRKETLNPLTVGRFIKALDLDESWIDLFIDVETTPDGDETKVEQDADRMLRIVSTDPEAPSLSEELLIALAYEYAEGDTTDLQSAYKGLRAALETAQDMAARAALPDNTDAGVQAVRAEVQRLNDLGDPEAAGAVIDDLIARQSAGMAAALNLGVQQDRLRNDPKAAAEKVMQRVRLEVLDAQLFNTMRQVQDIWYEKGRDKGLNFESKVAICLARMTLDISRSAHERGTAGNDLGLALQVLGERESGTDSLDQAVTAYRAALEEFTRDRVPMDWARTQANLASLSLSFFTKSGDAARLDEADAYAAAALEVFQEADATYYIALIESLRGDIAEQRKMLPAL